MGFRDPDRGSLSSVDKAKAHKTSGRDGVVGFNLNILSRIILIHVDALFYSAILTFVAGLLLLMSFASPYWLVSWEDTESPFKNMGLWEFCFFRYHHPDYQFDKLFHGCHALYGDEYRLIREKLLPGKQGIYCHCSKRQWLRFTSHLGWLMVVQLFVTLAFILSFACQLLFVALLLRYPLEVILRFEYHFCGVACILNGITCKLFQCC